MKRVKSIIGSRLFLAFLGLLFLSLVIWFAGPMLGYGGSAPLQGTLNRLMAIGSLSLLWLLMALLRFLRSRRDNARMLDTLASEGSNANESASAEELAILQEKMQQAVETLRRRDFSAAGGGRFLTDLPWYVIIGPPGAGKTTLLSHSGLDFPLEETHGKLSVKGLGGTRNCDWWFTDQAVLLDTAGRYATQDSETEVDRNAWNGFLTMLRDKRRQRPLNGVLLALSIEDVLQADDSELEQIARTLRTRVEELYQQLGIAPPVYLLLTKCDLLAGFSEFFDDLDRDARQQVWGHTLSLDDAQPLDALSQGLEILQERLHAQSLSKLHAETGQRKREHIYGFPMQFNVARQRVKTLLERLTAQSRLLQPILFRGVYFTSATQTGSVLDQVIQNVSRNFGISETSGSGTGGEGRSHFIRQLLTDVIFTEAGLAGTHPKSERRRKWLQAGAVAALVLLSLGLLSSWSISFIQNRDWLADAQADAGRLQRAAESLDPRSPDLLETGRLLDLARAQAFPDESGARPSGRLLQGVGLHQGERVSEMALSRYDTLLQEALLPRLMVRLEQQMQSRSTDSEFLFEALKTYRMLGLRDRFVADDVVGWFNFDIDTQLTVDVGAQTRASLKRHVQRLFRDTPRRLPRAIDESLVRQYQQIAATTPLAQRAYGRIRQQAGDEARNFIPLSRVVSPELTRILGREDEQSLDRSLNRFHSVDSYHAIFLPASERISQALSEDAWVLGEDAQPLADADALTELQAEVIALYHADYIDQWQRLFDNLRLRRVGDLDEATRFIALISDQDSPLKDFLVFASEQTTLARVESNDEDAAQAQRTERENDLASRLAEPTANSTATPLEDPVARHFSALHALVDGVDSGTSTLDTILAQLADLNLQLLPMAQAPAGSVDPTLNRELSQNLQRLALRNDRLAEPLASVVSDLSRQLGDVAGGGFCQQLDSAWKADVLPFYQRAIRGRYPVNRTADVDIALSDFGAFFGPGGVIDTFVTTYLTGLVQRTARQWTWVGTGSAVCLSDNTLRQLAFADDIRNTFFANGGNLPGFRFDLLPNELLVSPEITRLQLDIGGSGFDFSHGPTTSSGTFVTAFAWPPASNNTQVSLRVEPVIPGTFSGTGLSGPWAVLRLFDQGRRDPRASGLAVSYDFGGRTATLTWSTSSFNPLDSVALRNFRAPEDL